MSKHHPHHHDHEEHDHNHGHHGHNHDHSHHNHSHSGGHVHVAQDKLKRAIFLGALILAAEVFGGFWANSLALLSDAGHMLTDVAALIAAWFAVKISANPPSNAMTYGYHRATILAALFNALTLVAIAIYIGVEAYQRILNPEAVQGAILFITAGIGIVLNLYIGLGMRDQADNVNIKSAMLHVFGDAIASAGVIVAGVVMYFTKWYILDPILSVLIALIVAVGAWRVIKETYVVLMEGTPKDIDFDEVVKSIQSIPGVQNIHDLHIWSLTSNRNAMSGHIVVDGDYSVRETQQILREIEEMVSKNFRIGHSTLQIEDDGHPHEQEMFGLDRGWKH